MTERSEGIAWFSPRMTVAADQHLALVRDQSPLRHARRPAWRWCYVHQAHV